MKTLEGKTLSEQILNTLPARCEAVKQARGFAPSLAIVNYYPHSPSAVYMRKKAQACEKAGIKTEIIVPGENSSYEEFLKLINDIAQNKNIDALMVERPLPKIFEIQKTWDLLPADKDVDGLSTLNMGRLFSVRTFSEIEKGNFFVPCTALAVIKLMQYHNINIAGENIAVIGRSTVVGKPLAHMLLSLNATVTLCHTKTKNISEILKKASIVISAAGSAHWLKKDMLSNNCLVIDVGTNFDENGKMCGDADFNEISTIAAAITPVPGGVGPVTKACLLEAAVKAAENKVKKDTI